VLSLLLWGLYSHELGIKVLLTTPAGHDASAGHLLGNVQIILRYFLTTTLLYAVAVVAFYKLGRMKYAVAQAVISVFVTVSYSIGFFSAQIDVFRGIRQLPDMFGLATETPGEVFKILLLVFLRWMGELFHDAGMFKTTLSGHGHSHHDTWGRSLFRARLGNLVSAIQSNMEHRKFLLAIGGLFLVVSGYAAGSASSFAICLSAFSAPALGTAFVLWNNLDRQNPIPQWLAAAKVTLLMVWLALFGVFAATINLPTLDPITGPGRVQIREAPLTGIDVLPRYQNTVAQLRALYEQNDCRHLSFVTLDYVPMVYFILNHALPREFGIVRPAFYFPEAAVQRELDPRRGWCVLDVTTRETQWLIDATKQDMRSDLRGRLQRESQGVFQIPSPSYDIGPLQLYVRNSAAAK
jgi:hypothetical protein